MAIKQSVRAINQMVLSIEDKFGSYKFVDVVEKDRGYKYVRSGYTLGSVMVPVATIMQGYSGTHQKTTKVVTSAQARKIVLERFSDMAYSPERDLIVPSEAILRSVSRCIDNADVEVSYRINTVRYIDTVDLVISAKDAECIAEVSFRGAAMFTF